MYSFLSGQILFFTLYLISTIFSTRFRLFEIGRSERNHFLLWMLDFYLFCLESPTLMWRMFFFSHYSIRRLVMRRRKLACYWWVCLSFGKKVIILNVNFSYTASAFSVSYSFLYHLSPLSGITLLSFLDLSLGRLAHHTKRSSHKLAASIVVVVVAVAVAAVEEDLRNTRCGSFYSADDFYRGVPSPSVRLLRASYSMTSW